jgi:hypothetical protein
MKKVLTIVLLAVSCSVYSAERRGEFERLMQSIEKNGTSAVPELVEEYDESYLDRLAKKAKRLAEKDRINLTNAKTRFIQVLHVQIAGFYRQVKIKDGRLPQNIQILHQIADRVFENKKIDNKANLRNKTSYEAYVNKLILKLDQNHINLGEGEFIFPSIGYQAKTKALELGLDKKYAEATLNKALNARIFDLGKKRGSKYGGPMNQKEINDVISTSNDQIAREFISRQ